MRSITNNRFRHKERGVALVVALLALMLITAVAVGMLLMSNTEGSVSSNFRDEQTAFFSARGGLEEGRERSRSGSLNSLFGTLPTNLPGQNNGILYVTNMTAAESAAWTNPVTAVNYPDTEICLEVTCSGTPAVPGGAPWYTTTTASASYAAAPTLNWKWLRIMAKANKSVTTTRVTSVDGNTDGNRVCWKGKNEVVTAGLCGAINAKPVYTVTALAVTASGSRRMLQYEISQTALPNMPGAMVFDGANPHYGAPNSNAFDVSGTDAHSGPTGTCSSPVVTNSAAVGAFDNAGDTYLTGVIPRPAKYTGPSGATPDVQNVNTQLAPLDTVGGIKEMVAAISAAALPANVYPSGASPSSYGTNASPQITVVNGDLSTSGISGAGILLVTGKLTMSGNPSFNGIIMVVGDGYFQKNGGGNGTTNGSIFIANLYDTDWTTSSTRGNALPSTAAPGKPWMDWNGGGNAGVHYDSCWTTILTNGIPFKTIAQRELMY